LWSHVREQVNPWEVASFRTRLVANAPSGFVLQNADAVPRYVTIMVRGPHLTLRQLKGGTPANPLAGSEDAPLLTSSSVRATLDFSAPHRGEQKVPVKVETKLEDVEMVGAKPNEITVKLDTAARRKFAIKADFDLPMAWQATEVVFEKQRAEVAGASQLLARVEYVRALVQSKVSASGTLGFERVPLEAIDKNGAVVRGLGIEPKTIRVRATIVERQVEKTVPIKVRLTGAVANGYEVGSSEVEPARVTLRGVKNALEKMDALWVTFELDGESYDVARHVQLQSPQDVEIISPLRVRVRVPIKAIAGEQSTPADARDEDVVSNPPTPPPATGLPKPALRH
jgi:YbbR domain-containing protein